MKKLGLIVNPIAGMGGRVGLKGTDGEDAHRRAVLLGALPEAQRRAEEALSVVARALPKVSLLTCTGAMGEEVARRGGMSPTLIHDLRDLAKQSEMTSAENTRHAAREMRRAGVDLLLFAGGDGTARDICDVLASADADASANIAALGIPAGVKMHSGVFALNPRRAGEIAVKFLRGEPMEIVEAEVMDIDEEAFRSGRVTASLHGYLRTPQDFGGVQTTKSGSAVQDDEAAMAIARHVVSNMADDTLYIIAPGTTTAAISQALDIPNTLLGVDVALNRELLVADATESDLLRLTDGKTAKIIVSVIGGQGYIFGRGNQQISPKVIRRVGKDNIIVVATSQKLLQLYGMPLLVDTGDPTLDAELSGYVKVVTGRKETQVHRIAS